jgi:hypothetical protein
MIAVRKCGKLNTNVFSVITNKPVIGACVFWTIHFKFLLKGKCGHSGIKTPTKDLCRSRLKFCCGLQIISHKNTETVYENYEE